VSRDRFDRLEEGAAAAADAVLARWTRFERLEIAGVAAPGEEPGRTACAHCGRGNEPGRDHCWACYKPLGSLPPAGPTDAPIKIVLNGVPYHSTDPHLPADVRDLMARVRREGATPAALARWSATRAGGTAAAGNNARVSVRVDGRVFRRGDPDAPAHVRDLLEHLHRNDVSPALLDGLRAKGAVTVRPANTPRPSDGDIAFWSVLGDAPARAARFALPGGNVRFFVGALVILYLLRWIFR
jgi:hypothetical protein